MSKHSIPSPGGRVAPKGSGEECGRKAESQHNQTDLCQSFHEVGTLVEVFTFPKSLRCRPHSSSVMEIAFGDFHDSFSPGEAIGCCRTRGFFVSLKNWAKRGAVRIRRNITAHRRRSCGTVITVPYSYDLPGRTTRVSLDYRQAQCTTVWPPALPGDEWYVLCRFWRETGCTVGFTNISKV